MNEPWFGARMTGPRLRDLLAGDRARAEERQRPQPGEDRGRSRRRSSAPACASARGRRRSARPGARRARRCPPPRTARHASTSPCLQHYPGAQAGARQAGDRRRRAAARRRPLTATLARVTPAPSRGHAARRAASRRSARRARRRPCAARSARRSPSRAATSSCVHAPTADAGEQRRAERRRLGDLGDRDGHAEHVGLKLHEPAVGGRAAVGAQLLQRLARRRAPSPARRRRSGRRSPRASRARGARAWCRA